MNCAKCKHYDSSVNACDGDVICSGEYEELKGKIDKYKWHDLRKDRDDVPTPTDERQVLVCVSGYINDIEYIQSYEVMTYTVGWDYENDKVWLYRSDKCDKIFTGTVHAWKEIELFEEVDE